MAVFGKGIANDIDTARLSACFWDRFLSFKQTWIPITLLIPPYMGIQTLMRRTFARGHLRGGHLRVGHTIFP